MGTFLCENPGIANCNLLLMQDIRTAGGRHAFGCVIYYVLFRIFDVRYPISQRQTRVRSAKGRRVLELRMNWK